MTAPQIIPQRKVLIKATQPLHAIDFNLLKGDTTYVSLETANSLISQKVAELAINRFGYNTMSDEYGDQVKPFEEYL